MINRHRKIGIIYPYQESSNGDLFAMSTNSREAVKSNLAHLLNTRKGERYYYPDFGIDFLKYLFQPLDEQTVAEIRADIDLTVKKFLFNMSITNVTAVLDEIDNFIGINVEYTVTDGFLQEQDFIEITY